jgi:hypothetical protein
VILLLPVELLILMLLLKAVFLVLFLLLLSIKFWLFGFLNFCWCFSPIVRAFVVFASVFVVKLHLYITDKLFVIRQ